ncbi:MULTISPECIES: hypothetical protein [Bacillus]|jgi:hypothetical protein|nr:hypothetical protein [Bacillus pseudomycoides]EEM06719.1 hypothetical protein bmyco0002_7650 [Bacillus pseudomycoides]MCR8860872.1 hypothetical protein [Bacillus pseudomycoides]MED1477916.1 hypothetical protein [Bacillus pseudomycoides]MED1536549.1 hypothetical protein [Bacillus pseudomycoides]MED1624329.1 hypothetical protein [Bacillus pseudomycoides]
MSKSNEDVKQKRGCAENGVVKPCNMCKACGREKENEKYMSKEKKVL